MIEIKDLLFGIREKLLSETNKKEVLSEVIFNQTKIKIPIDKIKIKGDSVYLDTKPLFKSEFLLKKEGILEELSTKIEKFKRIKNLR